MHRLQYTALTMQTLLADGSVLGVEWQTSPKQEKEKVVDCKVLQWPRSQLLMKCKQQYRRLLGDFL